MEKAADIKKSSVLSFDSNENLVLQYQAEKDPALLGQIWEDNKLLVFYYVNRYGKYAEREDLEQEGFIAICNAAEHFDPRPGVPFGTYAGVWVRWMLQRYIDSCRPVHISYKDRLTLRKYNRLCNELEQTAHRRPTEREIRYILGISKEQLRQLKNAASVASLDASIDAEDDASIMDLIPGTEDFTEDIDRQTDREILQRELWMIVNDLPEDKAELIRKHYKEGIPLTEIARQQDRPYNTIASLMRSAKETLRRKKPCQWYYKDYMCSRRVTLARFMRTHTSEQELYMIDHYC